MDQRITPGAKALPFWFVAGGMVAATALAQAAEGQAAPTATQSPAAAVHKISPYTPLRTPSSARDYYQSVWGVDNMLVRQTASGNLIRFSYRVTEPVRAHALGDKHATPYLFAPRSNAVLHIPVMDKIGQLRQTGVPEAGQEYWMVFSNKGNLVKSGDRVNVVIGSFHADGLMVE